EPEPEAARATMLARLAEFDADGDGSLSLAEFEALHAAMIRETMVDRFQHLDADGNGRITESEMGAPARRMEMRRGMPGAAGMMDRRMPSDN
ncbi:MAG: calcium-binding protein, partial [Alphaproteobacteria bacterium]|nr:calcium-binding protein [Alphaproteobacteria bacterium]